MTCWNREIETMPREEMTKLQSARLREAVARAYSVPIYRAKMEKAGIKPGDIRGVEDLHLLPFTEKTDLRDAYPFGMFAAPMEDVVRIHASSGTTGKQTVVGYTQKDVDIWTECMARSMTQLGVGKGDIIQVAYGYGLFTGGLGGHYGGERIGAATIPASVGNTKRQLQIMVDFGSTALLCTPSYAMQLGDAAREAGIKDSLKLKVGLFGAEPWTDAMRVEIEKRLGLDAYDIYGLSEISGPGVSCECTARMGLHVQEDHFYPEIVDPDTKKPVPDGVPGELVFTCLTKDAMALMRYNTRDICTLSRDACACGRTTARMGKLTGRTDDMLIIRGINVFPSQVESVLLGIAEVAPHYFIVVDRAGNLDTMEIQVEMTEEFFSDEVRVIEALERRIAREIQSTLSISAKIRMVGPGSLPRSEGKSKRVQDNRSF
ncbi:MAG: phenylacetate--CoA ligase [Oscillospiraceae bacterium]|jgi:phenylacetate-CoA ligase|nr:phenylacetate--CoA ligase [Oscillospiraceae bacterium]